MDLGTALRQEIRRIARKELKPVVEELRAVVRRQKSEIAALKQALATNRQAARRAKQTPPPTDVPAEGQFRFSAARLAALREKKDLTQAELAQLLDTSVPTLIKWLKGEGRPSQVQLARIAWVRGQGKRALRQHLAPAE